MTVPLYDVKAHLSEYVTYAENGEVVEITKHGVATTVMISLKMFNDLYYENQIRNRPSFIEAVQKWREENFEYLDDEYADTVERLVQEDKKIIDERGNPWN
ncbi:MAG: type II toxin-antitoxin system prevent-host-death family antitoxin [Treponema sp.]|nr:type II toxin-antitoxin system prevent-host-death family antitoxin [Treponema sp.]